MDHLVLSRTENNAHSPAPLSGTYTCITACQHRFLISQSHDGNSVHLSMQTWSSQSAAGADVAVTKQYNTVVIGGGESSQEVARLGQG